MKGKRIGRVWNGPDVTFKTKRSGLESAERNSVHCEKVLLQRKTTCPNALDFLPEARLSSDLAGLLARFKVERLPIQGLVQWQKSPTP